MLDLHLANTPVGIAGLYHGYFYVITGRHRNCQEPCKIGGKPFDRSAVRADRRKIKTYKSGRRKMDPKIDGVTRKWYEQACRMKQAGRLSDAIRAFTQSIHHNTGFAEAYYKRGECYYLLGRCQLAADDLQAAALLGCKAALLWSRYDIQRVDDIKEP